MKKILLSMILMIITLATIGVSIAIATTTGVVNSVTVNLRKEPSTSSKILIQVGEESEVTILGESGDWYEVEYDGVTGYISKSCIDVESTSEISNSTTITNTVSNETTNSASNSTSNETSNSVTNEVTNSTTSDGDEVVETEPEENSNNGDETEIDSGAIILSEDTDIRLLPSMTSSKSNTIEVGSTVTVLITLNNWVKITDGSLTGWVVKTKLN